MQEPERNKGFNLFWIKCGGCLHLLSKYQIPRCNVIGGHHAPAKLPDDKILKKQSTLACSCVLIQKLRINHDFRIESTNNTLHDD